MKKRDRIAKKRAKIERVQSRRKFQRWAQKNWPAYWKGVPFNKATVWTLKAHTSRIVANLSTANPILAALKKLSPPAMEGFDSQNCAVAVVIGKE